MSSTVSEKSADAFRTISEVAEDLDLPQHVLRFWETRFPQIKPMKRGGGRRYYRPDDIELLKGIRFLLYTRGFTIKGVQRILKESGNRAVIAIGAGDLSGLDAVQAGRPRGSEAVEGEFEPVSALSAAEAPRRALSNLLFRGSGEGAASRPGIDGKSAQRLNEVILELLELKRILDQAR